jgi:hypothetical protein
MLELDEKPARAVLDILTGSWRAQALYATVALGIPDHVAAGHRTSAALASQSGVSDDHIERLMGLLTQMDVFEGDGEAGYELTAAGELLRSGGPDSMRDMCLMYGDEFYRAWGAAPSALGSERTAFEHAFDQPLSDYLRDTPAAAQRFQRAMSAGSAFFSGVPRAFDFSACRVVADIAGGNGRLLSMVLAAAPAARGLLFDLPHMVDQSRELLEATVGLERCDIVGGDFLVSVPAGPDVYLLSRVLQDHEDLECVRLLTNCRRAMHGSSKLLIVERVIEQDGTSTLPRLWDLHLMMISGGRERTLAGYRTLLEQAGLRLESVAELPLETSMLIAVPAADATEPTS